MFPIVVLPAVCDRENPLSRLLLRIGCCICVFLAVLAGCPPSTGQVDRGSDFIRSARAGDTVTLYTFDRDTTLRGHICVSGEIDKKDLLKIVEDVPSEGDRTYTGKAIHDALERAIELSQRSNAADRTVSILQSN